MAEKKKGREMSVETPVAPLVDQAFREPGLTSITIEERRKWEAMYARFHEPHSAVLARAQAASVIQVTNTINEVVAPGSECYWVKVADDVHYLEGDVYCAYGVHAQHAILSDATASSYLRLVNPTDELRDTYVQHAAGSATVLRWTHGLAANYERDWILCLGDILTDTAEEETYSIELALDGYLVICDTSNYRIKTHLSADGAYQAKIGSIGNGDAQFNQPWGICSDGTWVYVTDTVNDRIKKHLLSNLSFVAAIGSHGSGNDNFDTPRGICTDGTWLYVVDRGNNRVVKRLCSDLSYVSETAGPGFNQPDYICTDGTHIYTVQTSGGTPPHRIFKNYCDDLSADGHLHDDGHIDNATLTGICTTGGYLYLINSNPGTSNAVVYKYACSDLTYVSEPLPFSVWGTADGKVNQPWGIATDGTNLWITDVYGIIDDKINKFLLDGTYVSHFGTYGSGDAQFDGPRGLCVSGIIIRTTVTPQRGPILRAAHDATSCQSYVSFHFRNESRWRENSVANTNYITLRAPASVTSYDMVLPAAQSSGAQFLRNDGAGALSWVTALTSVTAHNVLSSTHGDTLTGAVVKGDLMYGNATPKWARLAPNTTATKNFLTMTSSVPAWGTIAAADLPAHQLDGAVHSVSGLTSGHFLKATGATTFAFGAHGLTASSVGAEPTLPACGTTGFVLSSTDAQVRSWVAVVSSFVSLTDGPGAFAGHGGEFVKVKADASALEYVASSVAAHNLNSVTHGDTNLGSPGAGEDGYAVVWDNASSKYILASLGGGSTHALLSATHTDTTAAAVARGSLILGIGASPKWEAYAKGAANQVLGGDGTDSKWVTACPAAAQYIVGAAHADLTAEKVKPQLYLNYDIDDTPAAPNALDDEFDNGSLDGKWTIVNAPGTRNWDETTYPGFLSAVIPETAAADNFDNHHRIYQAMPGGNIAITIVAKVSLALTGCAGEDGEWASCAIYFGNPTDDQTAQAVVEANNATSPAPHGTAAVMWAGGYKWGASGALAALATIFWQDVPATGWVYLKLEKPAATAWTSAQTYNFYMSLNGIVWHQVATDSLTFTTAPTEVGIYCRPPKAQAGAPVSYPAIDFFRRTV